MAAVRESACPSLVLVLALLGACASFDPPPAVEPRTNGGAGPKPGGPEPGPADPLLKDYYDVFEDTTTVAPPAPVPTAGPGQQPCRHDVCSESQPPCAQLAASTGCLCPGITLDDVVPHPPGIKRVSGEGSRVVVSWCAPYSRVNSYKVTVDGRGGQVFGEGRRSGAVEGIGAGADVCVFAVNDAGASEGSCARYESSDRGGSLRAGLIGGALGLLLLLLLAALLWKYAAKRTPAARISTREAAESQGAQSEPGAGLGVV